MTTWSSFWGGQSSKAGVTGLTYREGGSRAALGQGARARDPWRAPGRPDLAECSEAFQPQPGERAQFPAPASTTGCRPSSGTRFTGERGAPGKAPTSLPSSLPPGPHVPALGTLRVRRVQLRRAGQPAPRPAAALGVGGAHRPRGVGQGAAAVWFAPAAPRGRGLSGLGAAPVGEGAVEPAPGGERDGEERDASGF